VLWPAPRGERHERRERADPGGRGRGPPGGRIRENLELEGYSVEVRSADGLEALARIRDGGLELVVLDVMLPGMDGFTVCETVRAEGTRSRCLFLTARTTADDRVRGLEAGGDDYLPKPFHLKSCLLRVAAMLRRRTWYGALRPRGGGPLRRQPGRLPDDEGKSWDGVEELLTQKEAMILKALASAPGKSSRARRSWRRSGATRSSRRPARSTTSSCA